MGSEWKRRITSHSPEVSDEGFVVTPCSSWLAFYKDDLAMLFS